MIFCFSQDSHTQHNDSDAFQFYGRFKTSVKTCQQVDNSLACCEMYILRPPNWGLIRPMNLYLALSCVFFSKITIVPHKSCHQFCCTGALLTSSQRDSVWQVQVITTLRVTVLSLIVVLTYQSILWCDDNSKNRYQFAKYSFDRHCHVFRFFYLHFKIFLFIFKFQVYSIILFKEKKIIWSYVD